MLKSMSMVFGKKQWTIGNPHGCIVGKKIKNEWHSMEYHTMPLVFLEKVRYA